MGIEQPHGTWPLPVNIKRVQLSIACASEITIVKLFSFQTN